MSVSAASDPARSLAPRALGRRRVRAGFVRAAACALLAAALVPVDTVRAQTPGASEQIYIPGPGETHGAPSNGMISIPGPGETASAAANGASANGMIVIPGPGEARAGRPAATTRVTPREVKTAAANRSLPVIETAPQRTGRAVQPVAAEQPANAALAAAKIPVPARAVMPASMPAPPSTAPVVAAAPSASAATAKATAAVPASNAPAGQEDGETIRRAALAYLQQQTVGLPGKIGITVAQTFPRGLAACTTLEPFMPTGARLWGRTTVGVRCAGEKPWTLYLQARIAIHATYYLAAHQIEPGAVVRADDLLARDGDLSNLPRAVITDPSQAVGATATMRISAGMPLRQDLLKSASAVTIGQTVRVVAQGVGFSISSEGSVMNNATPGQQVRVKMAGGQIISGIVKDGGTVQVPM